MLKGNGTGPIDKGPGIGRGVGLSGEGRVRGDGFAAVPGSYCVCPNCGERAPHQLRSPCYNKRCPKCGTAMTLEVFE
jgi:hypothetical protein